jgi:hypothetical protein
MAVLTAAAAETHRSPHEFFDRQLVVVAVSDSLSATTADSPERNEVSPTPRRAGE